MGTFALPLDRRTAAFAANVVNFCLCHEKNLENDLCSTCAEKEPKHETKFFCKAHKYTVCRSKRSDDKLRNQSY